MHAAMRRVHQYKVLTHKQAQARFLEARGQGITAGARNGRIVLETVSRSEIKRSSKNCAWMQVSMRMHAQFATLGCQPHTIEARLL